VLAHGVLSNLGIVLLQITRQAGPAAFRAIASHGRNGIFHQIFGRDSIDRTDQLTQ